MVEYLRARSSVFEIRTGQQVVVVGAGNLVVQIAVELAARARQPGHPKAGAVRHERAGAR
ncbi:hypothetical protein [Saccharopolyspora spinosa]|uniref:hypothetical protein n=1 Tax=Saccharopolyspora spinosa TaxID=60894 RepID=UPI000237B00D|nr:hypothetical protein [Saccharopolyspora spinosa]